MPIPIKKGYQAINAIPDTDFHFSIANTPALLNQVFDSRLRIFETSFPYLIQKKNSHPAKDSFDDHSIIFCCRLGNRVVASCRVTPLVNSKWEISDNMPPHVSLEIFSQSGAVQLNRVYLEKEFRNQHLHEYLFYFFSQWVMENTNYDTYFATCNAGLVRLYSSLGAQLAYPDGFKMIGRGRHNYYLVHGKIASFNEIAKAKHFT